MCGTDFGPIPAGPRSYTTCDHPGAIPIRPRCRWDLAVIEKQQAEYQLSLRSTPLKEPARSINWTISRRLTCKSLRDNPGPEDRRRKQFLVQRPCPADRLRVIMGPACVSCQKRPSKARSTDSEKSATSAGIRKSQYPADRREYFFISKYCLLFAMGRDQRRVVYGGCNARRHEKIQVA